MTPLLNLDASLGRTLTVQNGLLQQWASATANLVLTQNTLANKPRVAITSDNRVAVNFDGVDDYMLANGVALSAPVGVSFVVFSQDLAPKGFVAHFSQSNASDDAHYVFLAQHNVDGSGNYAPGAPVRPRYRVNNGGGATQWDIKSAAIIGQGGRYIVATNLTADGTVQLWVNGVLTGTLYYDDGSGIGIGQTNWNSVPTNNLTTVGCWYGLSGPSDFSNSGIHEIAIYGAATGEEILTETRRLADKWNITL